MLTNHLLLTTNRSTQKNDSAESVGLNSGALGTLTERQGLLERDAENSYLAGDGLEAGPLDQILGSSITYRIAVGPQHGRKVFTLQTLPVCNGPLNAEVGVSADHQPRLFAAAP